MRFLICAAAILVPVVADALTIVLDTEFDGAESGSFATLEIAERDGALDFSISVHDGSDLGDDADLQELYLNFIGDVSSLSLSTTDDPRTPYTLIADPSVRGGAGSEFDLAIHFGNGAGPRGNGTLQLATFTLTGTGPLSISDLFEISIASGGQVEVHVAAHFQGTDFTRRSDSETVGALVPEPGTALLLGAGLGSLALRRRAR